MQFQVQARTKVRGFTLIELLVALLIFVLLAAMSYGGLRTVLDAQQSFEKHNDRLAELQLLFMMMGRDIRQIVDRPIRDNYGDKQAALIGGLEGLEFTRAGRRNPAQLKRSQLQRVGWQLEDGKLMRLSWNVLDRAQDSVAIRHQMSAKVEQLEIRFLDQQGKWHEQWPLENPKKGQSALPAAVEVNIELEDWGRVRRLYPVPGNRVRDEKKADKQ